MPSGRARAPGGGEGWALALALVGCAPQGDACARIEAARLWLGPPSGSLCVVGDLVVEGRGPDELSALEFVEEIDGGLIIVDNPMLTNFPELPALTRIGGALAVSGNATLEEITGFPALTEVDGRIYIAENPRLETVELGPQLTFAGTIFIALNPSLKRVGGLKALEWVETDLRVESNESLLALTLPALTEVGGDFVVADHPALTVLEAPELRVIAGSWSLLDNLVLESLAGLSAIEHASEVRIQGNEALREVEWTAALEIQRSLSVVENAALERLSGADVIRLAPVTVVDVSRNPSLVEVTGFAGVEELAGLSFEANPALRSIACFSNLRSLSQRLEIIRNDALEGPSKLFPTLSSASTMWIFGNTALLPISVEALLSQVTTKDIPRVGDNGGEGTALDPCPWPGDGVCDAFGSALRPGTELCAVDLEDCEE